MMQLEMRQGRPLILALIALLVTPVTASADIAFVSERDGNDEIYVMNDDGSDQRRLTSDPGVDTMPAWSPDGRRIAFVRGFGADADVWVMNADGSDQRPVTTLDGADREPSWSPDGSEIAFAGTRSEVAEIRVISAAGGAERTVTATGGTAAGPAWSPDGRRIAFWREDLMQLRTVDAAGGADQPLVESAQRVDRDPAWSGDGSLIAFTGYVDPVRDLDLYITSADGSGTRPLVTTEGRDTNPAWSADGRIAFASDRDGGALDVYVMNGDGSRQTRLTSAAGEDDMPTWSPPPPVAVVVEGTPERPGGSPAVAPDPTLPTAGGRPSSARPGAQRQRVRLTLLRSSRVRIEPRRVQARLRVRADRAATVTLELRRNGRAVVRLTRRLRRGVNDVTWTKRIPSPAKWSGRRYELFLITTTPRST